MLDDKELSNFDQQAGLVGDEVLLHCDSAHDLTGQQHSGLP